MNTNVLLNKFSQGLVWNGIFYSIYKILCILLSFTLYTKLSTSDYSSWAAVNSVVFLVLLWIDCGLRKSIPRYCPVFAKNKINHEQFISWLITFQVALLTLIGAPILWYTASYSRLAFSVGGLKYYALMLFATEGMVGLLRLVYDAHFWQKQFNLLYTCVVLLEMITNFWFIYWAPADQQLVQIILVTKMTAGLIFIPISIVLLFNLSQGKDYQGHKIIDTTKTIHDFFVHSGVMWMSTNIKSFSERNVLFPYLTVMIGPAAANAFKVTYEGALFFHRMALKTIGATDTSVLSYVEEEHKSPEELQQVFTALVKKIITLCFPLLILSFFFLSFRAPTYHENTHLIIFCIVIVGYLFETLLSPYERVLETKRDYKLLWLSYIPYVAVMFCLFFFNIIGYASLITFMATIHIVRITGSLLLLYFARKKYKLTFPIRFAYLFAFFCILALIIPLGCKKLFWNSPVIKVQEVSPDASRS